MGKVVELVKPEDKNPFQFVDYKDMFRTPDDVHMGKNGWLFLTGGSNDVLKFYTDPPYFNDNDIRNWWILLEQRFARLYNNGIKYFHTVVPDKLSVYPEYTELSLPSFEQRPVNLFNERFKDKPYYLDFDNVLNKAKHADTVYYKTDTHWNYFGCYTAYLAVCKKLKVKPLEDLLRRPLQDIILSLDLGKKITPEIQEIMSVYSVLKNAKRVFANDAVTYNEAEAGKDMIFVGCHVIWKNDSPSAIPQKVVIFGDSYCEFRPHLLSGMLAETFQEVHFLWSANIDFKYVEEVKPDIVISEIAERFVKTLPTDEIDLRKKAKDTVQTRLKSM